MPQLNQQELLLLLETVRQIHQKSGELTVFLERMLQELKSQDSIPGEDYDPDAYLMQWTDEANRIVSSQKKEVPSGNVVIGGDCYA